MNLNDDVVYRCLRPGPLHQPHPGRSRSLVRHDDRLHDNFLLGHLSLSAVPDYGYGGWEQSGHMGTKRSASRSGGH
jgi:hypothetical protein